MNEENNKRIKDIPVELIDPFPMTDTTQGKRGYQERSLYHRVRYAQFEQKNVGSV